MGKYFKADIIVDNVSCVKKRIGNAVLVAVTKSVGIEEVKALKDCGIGVFGENRLDSAEKKIREISGEWHMIGHLQSNKVKKAVELFDCIDSVDSLKLARRINDFALESGKIMNVLVQVNIGMEEQKYGINPDDTSDFIKSINTLKGIKILGLMAIAPFVGKEQTRSYFRRMKEIFDRAKQESPDMRYLSIGMSNDYDVALEEGSNMVRIGTRLFEGI